MLSTLMEKVYNLQEQISNESREMEILRRNLKEMLELKSTVIEMKNGFDCLFVD